MLTQVLESQRLYFEDRLATVLQEDQNQMSLMESRFELAINEREQALLDEKAKYRVTLSEYTAFKKASGKKMQALAHKVSTLQQNVFEERFVSLGQAIIRNNPPTHLFLRMQSSRPVQCHHDVHKKAELEKDKQIEELNQQLRDMMFYMDTQNSIATRSDSDDIREGTVVIAPTSNDSSSPISASSSSSAPTTSASSTRGKKKGKR